MDSEDNLEFGRPESMTELLRAPSLRSVEFRYFCFTNAMCEATANALKEGSAIASLNLDECSFPEGGSDKIASALKRNATLRTFKIYSDSINEAFCDAMAASLLFNSTLQELTILNTGCIEPSGVWVASLFSALGKNMTLKNLDIDGFGFADELCPALQDGLGKNSTLERLDLEHVNMAAAGVSIFSFYLGVVKAVQSNKTLRTSYLSRAPRPRKEAGYHSPLLGDIVKK
jgi:Ran GTPase-activating protein (RanGAP) involved in mRNA processing and transport